MEIADDPDEEEDDGTFEPDQLDELEEESKE